MAFDLPADPVVGQVWGGPNGVDYKWDGVKWTGAMNEAGAYLSLLGGTTSGPISVPAEASGAQVPRAEEVVGRSSVIGAIMDFYLSSPPENWLAMNGGTHLRADYPVLWDLIQGMQGVGAGDGSTTFVLPNWNGRFRRAASSGGGVGSLQSDDFRSHSHGRGSLDVSINNGGRDWWFDIRSTYNGGNPIASASGLTFSNGASTNDHGEFGGIIRSAQRVSYNADHSHGGSVIGAIASAGGAETRPTNVAVLTCIRAR